jgi:hypothetical protein
MDSNLERVLEILDKINTISEGTPKEPLLEINKLSGEALRICNSNLVET